MNNKTITQSVILDCSPKTAFDAWLDSKTHSEMTGGGAKIDPQVNGKFTAWDRYINGVTLELDPKNLKIVQSWRENEENWDDEYFSTITVKFLEHGKNQTKLEFEQTGIPDEYYKDLEKGWQDFYWKPMREYFSSEN